MKLRKRGISVDLVISVWVIFGRQSPVCMVRSIVFGHGRSSKKKRCTLLMPTFTYPRGDVVKFIGLHSCEFKLQAPRKEAISWDIYIKFPLHNLLTLNLVQVCSQIQYI